MWHPGNPAGPWLTAYALARTPIHRWVQPTEAQNQCCVSIESARGKHIQRCRVSNPAGETARDAGVAWLEIQRLKLLSCERHCLQALGYMPMPVVAVLDVLDVVLHIVRHLSLN